MSHSIQNVAAGPVVACLARRLCCMKKLNANKDEQTEYLFQRIQMLSQEKGAVEEENSSLLQRAALLQSQADAARAEAERQLQEAQRLEKESRLNVLLGELRIERDWGEQISPSRAIVPILGAVFIGGPLVVIASLVGGSALEVLLNAKKHLNKEYFNSLHQRQKESKDLCEALGKDYPQELKTAWWNRSPPIRYYWFGRNFGLHYITKKNH